jgi:hypothetical protein
MTRLTRRLEAAKADLDARLERAILAVAPLSEVVADLVEAGVQASIRLDLPTHGQVGVQGSLVVTTFHDATSADPTTLYDLDVNPALGTIAVSTYVPTPEEDPEAYDLGARPEPLWAEDFHSADGGYGRRSIHDLREEIENAFVARAIAAPGPRP